MGARMLRKSLAVAVILLFIGMCAVPSTAVKDLKDTSPVSFDGNTLYVGGSGPSNYSTIQGAIDDSVDGDLIYVYNGTYEEFITIDKSITLQGEDDTETIITVNEDPSDHIITFLSDQITIDSFTIRDGGLGKCALYIPTDDNEIVNCIIRDNLGEGIIIDGGVNNIINHSEFLYNSEAIIIDEKSDGNSIIDCEINWCIDGIIVKASDTIIDGCKIFGDYQGDGIVLYGEFGVKNTQITNVFLIDFVNGIVFYDVVRKTYMNRCKIGFCNVGISIQGAIFNNEMSQCGIGICNIGMEIYQPCFFNRFIQNDFCVIGESPVVQVYTTEMFNIWWRNYWTDDNFKIGPYHVYGIFNWDLLPKVKPYGWNPENI